MAAALVWLVGRPRGRWATPRGRCVQTIATAGLLVTALGAWALAIVQPWPLHPACPSVDLTLPGPPWPKARPASAVGAELLAAGAAALRPVRRDPFAAADRPAADQGTPGPVPGKSTPGPAGGAGRSGADAKAADQPPAPNAAREMLEAVRRLRLGMTLVGPDGTCLAIIDGRECRQGDWVGGLEVVEVQEGRVKLRKGGIQCVLSMD
jgi:hypothetical protein